MMVPALMTLVLQLLVLVAMALERVPSLRGLSNVLKSVQRVVAEFVLLVLVLPGLAKLALLLVLVVLLALVLQLQLELVVVQVLPLAEPRLPPLVLLMVQRVLLLLLRMLVLTMTTLPGARSR
jgi:hypothetical protein